MTGKNRLAWSITALATIHLFGCDDNSSSSLGVNGHGPAGVAGAQVCLDLNDNYLCDVNEPVAQTGPQGEYTLSLEKADIKAHRLLWIGGALVPETGAPLPKRYVLVSVPGSPNEITVLSTILSVKTDTSEAQLKAALGISESSSLLGGYAVGGEIASFVGALNPLYVTVYGSAAEDSSLTAGQIVSGAVAALMADPTGLAQYVASYNSSTPLPPSNEGTTSTTVGDEIFQSIPVDAATMSFGIGMDEITRKVVTGAYCLAGKQGTLAPAKSVCQNSRNYLFRLLQSEKDLRDVLNVGGGIDLGTATVSGSLEGRFVDEMNKDTTSIYALIKAEYVLCGYKLFDVSLAPAYLTGDAEHASYTNNYGAFRAACGDRYLDTVTSGGAYYGLLKIQTDSLQHKKDLTVKLEGKYGKAGLSVSVKGDLESSVNESLKTENVTIMVGSRGVSPKYLGLKNSESQLIENLSDFFNAADQFLTAVSNPSNDCHDDTKAFRDCAYTASFADYATVAQANVRNATQVQNLRFTKKLMGQYEDYLILDKTVGDILAHSKDYDWAGQKLADVYGLLSYLRKGRIIMDAAFNKCLTDFAGCTNNPEATGLKSFNTIVSGLPFPKWKMPIDCHDLQRLLGASDTDSATVYLRGDEALPFNVSCRHMDTSEPATYLDLLNTSASVSTPSYNSSVSVDDKGAQTTSIYRKLQVNVNHADIEVVYDQNDSVSTSAGVAAVRPGNAQDCNGISGVAKANLDLTGTIFTFAPNVTFVATLAQQTRYEWVPTAMTFDNAKAYATSKGGRLVEIDNTIEFATLHDDLIKNHATTPSWVGLSRLNAAASPGWAQFKWIYKNTAITSGEFEAYFHSGEPNNSGGAENCVHFWSDGMFNDVSCAASYPFYIEYDYAAPIGGATFNSGRTAVVASVASASAGKCAEIKPASPIRLIPAVEPTPAVH